MKRFVWDSTALVGFFRNSDGSLWEHWTDADHGRICLVWPAAAITAANSVIGADWAAWHPFFFGTTVTCSALSEANAVETGLQHDDVPTAQVIFEAKAIEGVIVSTEPGRYTGLKVPVLPI